MDALNHTLHSIQSTRFCVVASATILVYDHLITLDHEIDLVWRKDWSLLKGVFIFHRYLGLVCVIFELFATLNQSITQPLCTFWFIWEMWGYAVVVLTSELVLLLWIWVIFERNIRILAALGVLFIAELISLVVILARSFARLSITANIIPGFNFCSLINEPEFFFWYWLPVLTYNTVIFILFLVKGSQSFRSISHVNTLLHDVYRRSFLNFLAIFIAYLLCCVFWIAADFSLGQIPVGFALSFSITNSTRLLINIRHAYYSREDTVDINRPITAAIYANQTPHEEWLFELRAMRLSGR